MMLANAKTKYRQAGINQRRNFWQHNKLEGCEHSDIRRVTHRMYSSTTTIPQPVLLFFRRLSNVFYADLPGDRASDQEFSNSVYD